MKTLQLIALFVLLLVAFANTIFAQNNNINPNIGNNLQINPQIIQNLQLVPLYKCKYTVRFTINTKLYEDESNIDNRIKNNLKLEAYHCGTYNVIGSTSKLISYTKNASGVATVVMELSTIEDNCIDVKAFLGAGSPCYKCGIEFDSTTNTHKTCSTSPQTIYFVAKLVHYGVGF
jgi:hypothetical protein